MARTSASEDRRHRGARKCLFDLSVPRLPPVQAQLYQAPETTQQALRSAFSGVMPRQVLLASSNMRGVRLSPPGSKKRLGLEDALPHIARVPLGRATYTESHCPHSGSPSA
ncbi:unnamed protein product [Effrenium voratum]|nr:unnamed protein product [Effrenium voratum]